MKRLIALRKRARVFGRGTLELVPNDNRKILSFLRRLDDETVLVVANLSRFVQPAELNLSAFAGHVPVELLGRTSFPKVGSGTYNLTLGPHSFYWFGLRPPGKAAAAAERVQSSRPLEAAGSWKSLLAGDARAQLSEAVADWLRSTGVVVEASAWKRPSALADAFPVAESVIAVVALEGSDARRRLFSVPLTYASGKAAADLAAKHPRAVIAPVRAGGEDGLLLHAAVDRAFCSQMLHLACGGLELSGETGKLSSTPAEACGGFGGEEPAPIWDRQGNVSVACGGAVLRLLTALEPGVSAEVEVPAFLRMQARFENLPPLLGSLQYLVGRESMTLAVANGPSRSERSAWMHGLDVMRAFLERALARPDQPQPPSESLLTLAESEIPPGAFELVGPFLHEVALLGKRTAELHKALGSSSTDPAFVPEPFTWHYQRSLYQSMRTQTREAAALLRRRLDELPVDSREEARAIIGLEEEALRRLRAIHQNGISAMRIRVHSDLHLGRVLFTGKDFLFTGFEGDSSRPPAERSLKRSPLWDAACLLRSFHYTAYVSLFGRQGSGVVRPEDRLSLERWTRVWLAWVCAAFLRSYLGALEGTGLVPSSRAELEVLLDAFLRERAVRELTGELSVAPERAVVPLKGLADLLSAI